MIHDLIPLTSPSYRGLRYLAQRVALGGLGRLYAHRATVTLTDSFYTKAILLKRFRLPDQKVHVVYPGIDPRFFEAKGEAPFEKIRAKYRIHQPYLLYVGNFKPHKRVDCLIEAFGRLSETVRRTTQLVLAGRRTPETGVLRQLVRRLGLEGQVVFTDFVAEEDLPSLYRGATLFVFPSSEEGVGLPPLEAMACGIPVIATHASSLPEILEDAAQLVEPGDIKRLSEEIEKLLKNPEEQRKRSQIGRDHAKRFSIQAQCQTFLSILEKILATT